MRQHDAQDASLLVFTFKEGLLSKVAHDLKLRAGRFELQVDEDGAITLTCAVRSLRVVNAMRDSKEAPEMLSPKDKTKIEDTLCSEIIDVRAHPEIRFVSTSVEPIADGHHVQGNLTICGVTKAISAEVAKVEDRLETEVRLLQSDFGIKPYSALFGALKVKPEVRVRLSVPAEAGKPN